MQNVLRASSLTAHGFSHGFSTRPGGVSRPPFDSLNLAASVGDEPSHVAENQRRFAAWVGYRAAELYTLHQVHGRQVRHVVQEDRPQELRAQPGDALVAPAGLPVGIRSADCVPVLLADPQTRRVAAVHAGWRGVAAGVVTAAVEALCEHAQAPSARLYAALFPHIRSCCFEVGEAVAAQLSAVHVGGEPAVFEGASGKPHVALEPIVRAQLTAAGVPAPSIEVVAGCTCCEPARFFSYRRDGAASGRHLTVIIG